MRVIALVAAALLMTVLAHFALPLDSIDPLRSTIVLLPLVLMALGGISIWTSEHGGTTTPLRIVTAEIIVLALLVLLTLARSHLGLRAESILDGLIAAGFALLLLHRLGWLVAGMRSTLRHSQLRFAPTPFLALPFVAYLAILPWTASQRPPDGDAPHYLLLTHSLAYDLDTDLRNNYTQGDSRLFVDGLLEPQPGDPKGANGELYSRHNMLLPLVLAPFYRVEGLFGALMVMAALTSLTCWLALSAARFYWSDLSAESVVAWGLLAFTAPFLLFSYQVWVEVPAAALVLLGWIQVLRLRKARRLQWTGWTALTVSVLFLPLLKIRFLLIAVPLAVLALWHGGPKSRGRTALLLLLVFATTAGILWFNQTVFDNPLKYHDIDGLQTYGKPVGQYLQGMAGLFFDCAFGLFAYGPIWALLLPAILLLARRRERILSDLLLLFLPYLLILAPRGEWFGAWSPPFRYGVVLLPLLALALVPLLGQPIRGIAASLLVGLAVATVVLTTLWIVMPGWTFNLAHGRSHLLDLLSSRLGSDVARFFPSSTRLRAATFLWPPFALILVGLFWWTGRRLSFRTALSLGVAGLLVAPAAVALASHQRATRVIEFEDPWIETRDGRLYPDAWVIYRPRFRGGWILPSGSDLEVPIVAGGEALDLEIDLFLRPPDGDRATVEISTGSGETPNRSTVELFGEWTTLVFRNVPWSEGERLRIALLDEPGGSNRYRVILDRARISWK